MRNPLPLFLWKLPVDEVVLAFNQLVSSAWLVAPVVLVSEDIVNIALIDRPKRCVTALADEFSSVYYEAPNDLGEVTGYCWDGLGVCRVRMRIHSSAAMVVSFSQ